MAETQYSIRVEKEFTYRGQAKTWGNKYFFDGTEPSDWDALGDAIVALEKYIFPSTVTITAYRGYAPNSQVAVSTKTYTQAGLLSSTGAIQLPGDTALVLRMATTKRTTKNHPVYVFSYFHGVLHQTSGGTPDGAWTNQVNNVDALGAAWHDGITVGARTYRRTTPSGELTTGYYTDPYIGHRDFLR